MHAPRTSETVPDLRQRERAMLRVLTVFGTRPEAIKLAPLVQAFQACDKVEHVTCVSAQHRHMLDQVLSVFGIAPDIDLDIMRPNQDLTHVTTAVLEGIGDVVARVQPDWVVVQGDTTTAFATALAAFYRRTRVAHVEAGLRTGNIYSPWPEEINRRLVSQLSTLHFAPTSVAAENLRREGVSETAILVTGNTVVDALQLVSGRIARDKAFAAQLVARFDFLRPERRLVLVTGHRRENFEGGLDRVCDALARLARRSDVEIVYPVHLNPVVQDAVARKLKGLPNVHLIEPLDYFQFVALMLRAYVIVTDSGGIQEEAPGLGKPVLVTRDTTERPEAIAAGTARLVGTRTEDIVTNAEELLDDEQAYRAMAQAKNPFGDGRASQRIVERLLA